ncbi:MAG: HEAT repeat domain-containing protein [Planctomycetales bacterium]|nr:HEAT repeat domain-containing protein [Planctomycetales bacterium]
MLPRCVCLMFVLLISCPVSGQVESDPLIEALIGLLNDPDAEMRALAYEQVRTEAEGQAATKAFAAQLPSLSPDAQAGLIRALAVRGDRVARPAVLDLLRDSKDDIVRVAAIESIGHLGDDVDVQLLMKLLEGSSKTEQAAAAQSLIRLRGDKVSKSLVTEMMRPESSIRVAILKILVARRELDTIPAMISVARDKDAAVRQAAMNALSDLAAPEHVPFMLRGVLAAERGKERDAAEKCVMLVCSRIPNPDRRAAPVLAAMADLSPDQRTMLLSTLGRIGGADAIEPIEKSLTNPRTHSEGLRAICNWPDASIAPRLIELIQTDKHPGHATTALRALIRVAPLSDDRTDTQRLELLRQAMAMCTRDTERNLILDRCRSIRTLDSLQYILPYIENPAYAKQACLSVVELAHHRELRDANKDEFHRALDRVIAVSKDPVIIDRAQRYKQGKTWVRPGK